MFADNEIILFIKSIISNVEDITPIGNHQLKRHQVYRLKVQDKILVLKLYHIANKWSRELSALKILATSDSNVPIVKDHGIEKDIEWLLYDYTDGIILNNVMDELSKDNLKDIIYDAGQQLGKIHSYKIFDNYGRLSPDLTYYMKYDRYSDYFSHEIQRVFKNVDKFQHKECKLIEESKYRLLKLYSKLDEMNIKARLCHNDYDGRNILVDKRAEKYNIKKIIDFEQSDIGDSDRDIIFSHTRLCRDNKEFIKIFDKGYSKYCDVNPAIIEAKTRIYNLLRGLSICGWAQVVDPKHYQEGIQILRDIK